MSIIDDLIAPETLAGVRAKIIGYAQAAGIAITDWLTGGQTQQELEAFASATWVYSTTASQIVRGFVSLDTSVDPGDVDPYDSANASRPAVPGFLSNLGANFYGTTRARKTFATGAVALKNSGTSPRTFAQDALTFTATSGPATGKTYRNVPDVTVYSGGTCTLAAGETKRIPLQAEEDGTDSNSPWQDISLTTTLQDVDVDPANVTPGGVALVASDGEDADTYRTRCRQESAVVSFGGAGDAYVYLASHNRNGSALVNGSGNVVSIARVSVSQDSSTGIALVYYANASGGSSVPDADVTAANLNIRNYACSVPDCITFRGAKASDVSVSVVGTFKLQPAPGRTAAGAKAAIVAAVQAMGQDPTKSPIGGLDVVAGTGTIYVADLQAAAASAKYAGLYDVKVTTPGADASLTVGQVAVISTTTGDWTQV